MTQCAECAHDFRSLSALNLLIAFGKSLSPTRETALFTIFPHTADAGLRVEASDLETLLSEAGQALFSLIVRNPSELEPRIPREFAIDGDNVEYLLVDWLSALLFAFESERLLFSEFEVSLNAKGLEAVARGERFDADRHHLEHEVKAITYHGLKVAKGDRGWTAEVIVDI